MVLLKSKDTRLYFFLVAALAIFSRTWVCDTASESFLYIDNYFVGNKFEFNKGTEGHPLWILLNLGLRYLGIPSVIGSVVSGYLFSLAGVYLLLRYAGKSALLLAVAVIVSNTGFLDFATSGLNTALVFFLLCHLFYEIVPANLKSPRKVSFILSILYLNQPEFAILIPYYFLFILYVSYRNKKYRQVMEFLLPVVIFVFGFHLYQWIWHKAGFPVVVTGSFLQGIGYLRRFLIHSHLFIPFWLLSIYVLYQKWHSRKDEMPRLARDIGAVFLLVLFTLATGGASIEFASLLSPFYLFVMIVAHYIQKWWLHELPPKKIFRGNVALLAIVILVVSLTGEVALYQADRQKRSFQSSLNFWKQAGELESSRVKEAKSVNALAKCLEVNFFNAANASCSIPSRDISFHGKVFCSLGNDYNNIMNTDFGVLVYLEPGFLKKLGPERYSEKTGELKRFYLALLADSAAEKKALLRQIQALEAYFGMKIMELPLNTGPEYKKYEKCWKKE